MNEVETEINRIITVLKNQQTNDGSWRYCLESGPMTDAYMIILLRTLNIHDEDFIRRLTERIIYKQEQNGAWKLFHDEEGGNLSATIEAYYALLFSGYCKKTDENMQAARQFILSRGGITEVSMLTKVMLALTGQYPWPQHALVPLEIMLLPLTFPLNFFDFVGYARVHVAPILIVADQKFFIKTQRTPNLSDLYVKNPTTSTNLQQLINQQSIQYRSILKFIKSWTENLHYLPKHIHNVAIRRTEQFMLDRIEPDGTLYSYFSSTFLMIFAFLALGYSDKHPVILHAIKGLKTLTCKSNAPIHIQNSTSTVWNTALLSYALQDAGVPYSSMTIQKAGQYLLSRQHKKYGDWIIHNPNIAPGGWGESCRSDIVKKYVPLGFSTLSQTAWAIDALIAVSKESIPAIERGIQYLIVTGDKFDWTTTYPTGAGLPGGFYFHYHSYRYIWPLLALSHYKLKYLGNGKDAHVTS